jgi:hypothetical protein
MSNTNLKLNKNKLNKSSVAVGSRAPKISRDKDRYSTVNREFQTNMSQPKSAAAGRTLKVRFNPKSKLKLRDGLEELTMTTRISLKGRDQNQQI